MTTQWLVSHGDILDVSAEVLVCSANVYLTLSGGVGGSFLARFGPAMQDGLFQHLSERGVRHVERGDVVAMPPCGSSYRAVLHAVAVDGFYDTTVDVTAGVLAASLKLAAGVGAETVAMTALATGYGRKPIEFFGEAIQRVIDLDLDFAPVRKVVVGLTSRSDVEDLLVAVPRMSRT